MGKLTGMPQVIGVLQGFVGKIRSIDVIPAQNARQAEKVITDDERKAVTDNLCQRHAFLGIGECLLVIIQIKIGVGQPTEYPSDVERFVKFLEQSEALFQM